MPGVSGRDGRDDPLPTQLRSIVAPEGGTAVAERDNGMSDLAYLSVRRVLRACLRSDRAPG
jgi:hypothetical protein